MYCWCNADVAADVLLVYCWSVMVLNVAEDLQHTCTPYPSWLHQPDLVHTDGVLSQDIAAGSTQSLKFTVMHILHSKLSPYGTVFV